MEIEKESGTGIMNLGERFNLKIKEEVNGMPQKIKDYMQPFITNNQISKENFDNLFRFSKDELLEVIFNYLVDYDIQIVEESPTFKPVGFDRKEYINLNNEELCLMYKRGNKDALGMIIKKNTRLIYSRVRKFYKYYQHDLSEEDLFQEGCIGLLRAVEKFDISLNCKLATYASHWIDQSINRAIADYGFTIRIPVHKFEEVLKFNKYFIEASCYHLSESETREFVKKEMGLTNEEYTDLVLISEHILKMTSLNTYVSEEKDTELIDFWDNGKEDETFEAVFENLMKEDLHKMLDTLKKREAEVIRLRFGIGDDRGCTLEEVGNLFGVTRERIRQIQAKALRRLRHPSKSRKLRGYMYDY